MVVELADLGGDLADLPSFQAVLGVEYLPVLLLKFPEFSVDLFVVFVCFLVDREIEKVN